MESFDFDRQFRLMELADTDEEAKRLSAAMHDYIKADPDQETQRRAAWAAAIDRLQERSMIELQTFRELMGQPVAV